MHRDCTSTMLYSPETHETPYDMAAHSMKNLSRLRKTQVCRGVLQRTSPNLFTTFLHLARTMLLSNLPAPAVGRPPYVRSCQCLRTSVLMLNTNEDRAPV